jgi:hypothetical protein
MSVLKSDKQIREQDNDYIDTIENYFKVDIESSSDAIDFILDTIDSYEYKDDNGKLNINKR